MPNTQIDELAYLSLVLEAYLITLLRPKYNLKAFASAPNPTGRSQRAQEQRARVTVNV